MTGRLGKLVFPQDQFPAAPDDVSTLQLARELAEEMALRTPDARRVAQLDYQISAREGRSILRSTQGVIVWPAYLCDAAKLPRTDRRRLRHGDVAGFDRTGWT